MYVGFLKTNKTPCRFGWWTVVVRTSLALRSRSNCTLETVISYGTAMLKMVKITICSLPGLVRIV